MKFLIDKHTIGGRITLCWNSVKKLKVLLNTGPNKRVI